jgi:hypothetical protein
MSRYAPEGILTAKNAERAKVNMNMNRKGAETQR